MWDEGVKEWCSAELWSIATGGPIGHYRHHLRQLIGKLPEGWETKLRGEYSYKGKVVQTRIHSEYMLVIKERDDGEIEMVQWDGKGGRIGRSKHNRIIMGRYIVRHIINTSSNHPAPYFKTGPWHCRSFASTKDRQTVKVVVIDGEEIEVLCRPDDTEGEVITKHRDTSTLKAQVRDFYWNKVEGEDPGHKRLKELEND